MEHTQRNPPLKHPVNKAHDCFFIIICCKGCRQPQSKGPLCRKRWFSCQICVAFENIFHLRTVDDKIIQTFPFDTESDFCYLLCCHFKLYFFRMINKHSVPSVCQIKRNVFIGLLRACSTVFIPDFHALSVLHKWSKTLSQSIDQFIYREPQLLTHISIFASFIISKPFPVCFQIGKVSPSAFCQKLSVSLIAHRPVFLIDHKT